MNYIGLGLSLKCSTTNDYYFQVLSGTVQLKEEENYLTRTKDLTAVPHDIFREKVSVCFLDC